MSTRGEYNKRSQNLTMIDKFEDVEYVEDVPHGLLSAVVVCKE
jgi:hypothetical protein